MHELIPVTQVSMAGGPLVQAVDARELHEFLGNQSHFRDWIKRRIADYSFTPEVDFVTSHKIVRGAESTEYTITVDMAKELAMVERNEKGRQARRYFIECERRLREQIQLPAPYADELITIQRKTIGLLEEENTFLQEENDLLWRDTFYRAHLTLERERLQQPDPALPTPTPEAHHPCKPVMAFSIIEQLEACEGTIGAQRVAELLGVTVKTVYKMVAEKKLPCVQFGASHRFDPSALSYWIRKQHPVFAAASKDAAKASRLIAS